MDDVPDLSFFIDLHAQLPSVLIDRTVVDTTSSRVVNHSTPSLVAIRESEAHLDVGTQWTSLLHELCAFVRSLNEHSLFDSLVDNELILDKVVINLEMVSSASQPHDNHVRHTLSALIHVNKDGSGSCRDVSMRLSLPMKIGACLSRISSRSCVSNLAALTSHISSSTRPKRPDLAYW